MINRPKSAAGIQIPDSTIATQATELLLEHGTEFLYNHSLRAFVFASLRGKQKKIHHKGFTKYSDWVDPEAKDTVKRFLQRMIRNVESYD